MKLSIQKNDIIYGGLIYAIGDSIAAIMQDDFSWLRVLGVLILGGTLYAWEIPNYFKWIDTKIQNTGTFLSSMKRAALAMIFFNPIWVARHIFFIEFFAGRAGQVDWGLLKVAGWSFLGSIPLSLAANYLIQNRIPFKHRFLASAVFSGIMAVYYAFSAEWFG